jgi:hypothetical protein
MGPNSCKDLRLGPCVGLYVVASMAFFLEIFLPSRYYEEKKMMTGLKKSETVTSAGTSLFLMSAWAVTIFKKINLPLK